MSPAKKSVIAGEYILSVLNNGSIEVCRSSDNVKIDNVKEALRQIAKQEGFEYDPNWNTRQFGNKLLNFLNGNGVNATTEESLDVSKGGKYTIELSLWAKGVQLLDVTEEEKDELSEGNLNDVFYDWASKYDYDFYYERQFICPDTEYFEFVVKDEEDNVVYETQCVSDLSDKTDEDKSREFKGVKDGYYLARVQNLKGMFFCGELELDEPFDAEKLYLIQDSKLDSEFVNEPLYPLGSIYYQQGEGYDSNRDEISLDNEGDMRETECKTTLFDTVNGNEWYILHETYSYGDDDEDYDDWDDDYDEDEDEEVEKIQCLNVNNELLFEHEAYYASDVNVSPNGMILLKDEDGMIYYANKVGEQVISDKFNDAGIFANGLAYVQVDGKYGYINEQGEVVIACEFDCAYDFTSNGLARVEADGKYSYINEQGKVVIACEFDYADDFTSNGLARVKVDGKYGYINEQGDVVIPCKFDHASIFSTNGWASVDVDGKWGYINEKGETVIPCEFDDAGIFANGLAYVQVNGKYGYINEQGEVIIACKFSFACNFASNGLARVKVDGKWGYINKQGEIVIACEFDNAGDFSNGLADVEYLEKNGVINTEDKFVIPCKYSELVLFAEAGLVFVKK